METFGNNNEYIGIDVDKDAVNNTKENFHIIHNDAIMPQNVKKKTAEYWHDKLPVVDFDKKKHTVLQKRFLGNSGYNFDIDTHMASTYIPNKDLRKNMAKMSLCLMHF